MKNSFKSTFGLIVLRIKLFLSFIKIKILDLILKKMGKTYYTVSYEEKKEKFVTDLCVLTLGIKIGAPKESLVLPYESLIKSDFLLYGVENRDLKSFLNLLEIPVSDDKKDKILKYLNQKLKELDSKISFE